MSMKINTLPHRTLSTLWLIIISLGFAGSVLAQAPIINPGAPGEPSKNLTAEKATKLAAVRYTGADVQFMQDMIPHHHQALVMSRLVAERTGRNELLDVAERIEKSQADEIKFMQTWLSERGEAVPDPSAHDAMHISHKMAGMASPEDMEKMANSEGEEFDQMFLNLMIEHHKGALTMVEELLEVQGAAYEPVLFEFTTDITSDQTAEIERMTEMLAGYSPDPRVGLGAGLHDAEQALQNMELLAALTKPPGFFDPDNPAGLPLERLSEDLSADDTTADPRATEDQTSDDATSAAQADTDPDDAADITDAADDAEEAAAAEEETEEDEEDQRNPPLSFANTDMAFANDVLVTGSYHGFNIYDISNDGMPELLSSVVCPGGQGDVSIVDDLLIMSVESTNARIDCGLTGTIGTVDAERFLGLRIFDISDLRRPQQVGSVQTCRGSHTHSVVSSDDQRIIVYNSGLRGVRDEEELPGCLDDTRYGDERTALFRIDVIEIPVQRPQDAYIVDSPTVFADAESGVIAGLWQGGDHGDDTQETNQTNHCHDITVFPSLKLAAGACSGNGILFDISDPLQPKRIDEVSDPNFAYWHSATFNNDGSKVLFTDEWGGGGRPRCLASDPLTWGANAIFDIVDGKLEFGSYYKMPAPQTEQENCVAHNGSLVPVPGRDIFVQAWYQGGISVMDFTDSRNPVEIAYFDRGPIDAEDMVLGGFWSVYWHHDLVYGTAITRGLDVLKLTPSQHLSDNEIQAASLAIGDDVFNPQQQFPLRWPAVPVVAHARLDQLHRSGSLPQERIDRVSALLEQAAAVNATGDKATAVSKQLHDVGKQMARLASAADNALTRRQFSGLADTLQQLAQSLR